MNASGSPSNQMWCVIWNVPLYRLTDISKYSFYRSGMALLGFLFFISAKGRIETDKRNDVFVRATYCKKLYHSTFLFTAAKTSFIMFSQENTVAVCIALLSNNIKIGELWKWDKFSEMIRWRICTYPRFTHHTQSKHERHTKKNRNTAPVRKQLTIIFSSIPVRARAAHTFIEDFFFFVPTFIFICLNRIIRNTLDLVLAWTLF